MNKKQMKKITTHYFPKMYTGPSTISFAYLAHIVGHNTQYRVTVGREAIAVIGISHQSGSTPFRPMYCS